MLTPANGSQTIWGLILTGGFTMYPLVICSLLVWGVILERIWSFRRLGQRLKNFHMEAMTILLRRDFGALKSFCNQDPDLPSSRLLLVALERLESKDERIRKNWAGALERKRLLLNTELRQNLWILGTIGSSAPFIGLFGTVVGILTSFQDMAKAGSGGFAVVAAGISESLIATAAGIVVAVIAVLAFNAFQTRWAGLVLLLRVQIEEMTELLEAGSSENGH